MDLKELGIDMRNWSDSAQDMGYCKETCEFGIETPGFVNRVVRILCGDNMHLWKAITRI